MTRLSLLNILAFISVVVNILGCLLRNYRAVNALCSETKCELDDMMF